MARSWVGLTIFACLPCMGTLQSTEAYYSYVNCLETAECYESAVVSSKNVWQTRLPPALRHKGQFAAAGHCRCASTIRGPFPYCATSRSRENASVGRPFALCIVRATLSRIDSDPI